MMPTEWKAKVAADGWFIYAGPKVVYKADHGIYELRVKKTNIPCRYCKGIFNRLPPPPSPSNLAMQYNTISRAVSYIKIQIIFSFIPLILFRAPISQPALTHAFESATAFRQRRISAPFHYQKNSYWRTPATRPQKKLRRDRSVFCGDIETGEFISARAMRQTPARARPILPRQQRARERHSARVCLLRQRRPTRKSTRPAINCPRRRRPSV